MPTNRKICSDISDFLRANNVDERVSYRYILSECRDTAQTLIKQDSDNRRLFKLTNLWKTIPCGVELEEVPLIECGFDIVDCRTLMKSKLKLPRAYGTNYGYLLRVSNIDGTQNFTETTFEDYNGMMLRRFVNPKSLYFFVVDDYLYIPNAYIEVVRVTGFFKDADYTKAGACKKKGECIKPLDEEFNCPDYLVSVVKEKIKGQLLASFQKPADQKPNLNSNDK